jgi:hypothetical protein
MSGIDEVLERLVTDAQFRELLQRDPAAALSGYVLYDEDLEVLAATLDDASGGERSVEQRTSKSAFLHALTGLIDESGGGLADQLGSDDGPAADASRFGSPTDMKDLPDPEDGVYAGAGKVGATDMRDLPDPEDGVYSGAGKVGATDMRDLPDPEDTVYDGQAGGTAPSDLAAPGEPEEAPFVKLLSVDGETTDAPPPPDGDSVDSEREAAAPDPVPAEDAEGPAGLRSDGELVQASDARDVPEAEETPDVDEEDPETALPRSARSPSDMTPGIEGSDVSTG